MQLLNILLIMQKLEKDIGDSCHIYISIAPSGGLYLSVYWPDNYHAAWTIAEDELNRCMNEEVFLLFFVKDMKRMYKEKINA